MFTKLNELIKNKTLISSYLRDMIDEIKILDSKLMFNIESGKIELYNIDENNENKIDNIINKYKNILFRVGTFLTFRKSKEREIELDDDLKIKIIENGKIFLRYYIHIKDIFLKRIIPNRFVYHVSNKKNRTEILKDGLKISENKNYKDTLTLDHPPAIFATQKDLIFFGRNLKENSDLWEIDTKKIDNIWYKDFNIVNDERSIVTFKNIPPYALKLVTEKNSILKESLDYNNTIYYSLYREDKNYILSLCGDTYNIKDFLKQNNFTWDSMNYSWKYKNPIAEENINNICLPLFRNIEQMNYKISTKSISKLLISKYVEGYEEFIFPKIQKGVDGKNIIKVKNWFYYAPMTAIWGNGAKYVKNLLFILGFNYVNHRYEGLLLKEDYPKFKEYLEDNNYSVIYVDENETDVNESKSLKNYETFYHQTDKKSAKKIKKEGFNTTEVWASPDDTASYGKYMMVIGHPTPKNPFILDINHYQYNTKLSYKKAQDIVTKNYKLYQEMGGEANPETFNKLRELGYDVIIEDNGDRCFLYPEKIIIIDDYEL